MSEYFLSDLREGDVATIVGYKSGMEEKVKRRALELGFTICQEVRLEKKSMLSDVLLFNLRGYLISLRRDIASFIMCKRERK